MNDKKETKGIYIKVGQIWREVDPRFNRYVQILSEGFPHVCVATIDLATNALGRKTSAACVRFNGKRGGYELYRDAK
jgi:hypothetical protein